MGLDPASDDLASLADALADTPQRMGTKSEYRGTFADGYSNASSGQQVSGQQLEEILEYYDDIEPNDLGVPDSENVDSSPIVFSNNNISLTISYKYECPSTSDAQNPDFRIEIDIDKFNGAAIEKTVQPTEQADIEILREAMKITTPQIADSEEIHEVSVDDIYLGEYIGKRVSLTGYVQYIEKGNGTLGLLLSPVPVEAEKPSGLPVVFLEENDSASIGAQITVPGILSIIQGEKVVFADSSIVSEEDTKMAALDGAWIQEMAGEYRHIYVFDGNKVSYYRVDTFEGDSWIGQDWGTYDLIENEGNYMIAMRHNRTREAKAGVLDIWHFYS